MQIEAGQCYQDGYGDCTGLMSTNDGKTYTDKDGRRFLPDGRMLTLEVDTMKDIVKPCGCGGKK